MCADVGINSMVDVPVVNPFDVVDTLSVVEVAESVVVVVSAETKDEVEDETKPLVV